MSECTGKGCGHKSHLGVHHVGKAARKQTMPSLPNFEERQQDIMRRIREGAGVASGELRLLYDLGKLHGLYAARFELWDNEGDKMTERWLDEQIKLQEDRVTIK